MDREDVIRMAVECGFGVNVEGYPDGVLWFDEDPMPFAALVAAAERERCAKVAEDAREDEEYGHAAFRCVQIAQDIRALT